MDETQKPFACKSEGCGMSFTNLDHLNVHTKKHAMVLHLSLGSKAAAYVADQTPTPTRLIRNCDEVGLFEDLHLQHVNPFEETFRQAVESKSGSSMTPTIDHAMIMDDELPHDTTLHMNDETTLHTPHVLPYYDLTNCTFKEESSITMGDDVIASQNNSDNDFDECAFKEESSSANGNSSGMIVGGDTDHSHYLLKEESINAIDDNVISQHRTSDCDIGDVKMKNETILDAVKPRPPALILSRSPSSLSTSFKQIVDETLSEEITASQPVIQNVKTLIVKPLPKLTRILPMIPVTAPNRIVKFETTSKIISLNLNDSINKRVLLPKSKSLDEKGTSVRDKLKAAILKSASGGDSMQSRADNISKSVMTERKPSKKEVAIGTMDDDRMKVSRNRAAAKRYRNKLKLWHHETKQRNIKLEEENGQLRAELRQLKSLLLAHQDCSVAKAMASGKHIPVGLPKIIVKEHNSDNISIINDVTMNTLNPVFLIVNKPIEYNSTVSIS